MSYQTIYPDTLIELASEAIRRGYNVCTRTRLKVEGKGDYHIDLKIRAVGGDINVIFLNPSPTSAALSLKSRIVDESYPIRILILNLDGRDYSYHLSQRARTVTVNRAEFWDAFEGLRRSECDHGKETQKL